MNYINFQKSFESKIPLPVKWPTMTHHSSSEAEDDDAIVLKNREMLRRPIEGPRSLDFFLLEQKKEKKRKGLADQTVSDKSSLLTSRRKQVELVKRENPRLRSWNEYEERQKSPRSYLSSQNQCRRGRELILSPLSYSNPIGRSEERARDEMESWSGKSDDANFNKVAELQIWMVDMADIFWFFRELARILSFS